MAILETACGCCSVHMGAKILAWIDIIFFTLRFIGAITTPVPDHVMNLLDEIRTADENKETFFAQIVRYQQSVERPIMIIPISVVVIVAAILLLVGLEKAKKAFLIPHLIVKGLVCGWFSILIIVGLVLSAVFNAGFLLFVVMFIFALSLNVYFWLWVFSVYQQMRESDNGPGMFGYARGKVRASK